MTFYETLQQTVDLLRLHGRVSSRAIRRQFALDEETLADLKAELVEVLGVAREEAGQTLVWTGQGASPSAPVPLLEAAVLPPPAPRPAAAADGERRFLTVMFIDLVESTLLSQRFDPEQLAEVYRSWQDACLQVIQSFGGHVAEYRGDGVFVYYSYPAAQEDAPSARCAPPSASSMRCAP
ncbi:hypothetical protein HK414_05090 [Ramlibacter terrae]|uniref:Guanylate cyclase domain-containing protein n=1 Tax=Ramlibacter terrae TaxID=2732511 RepID=A0ABX6P238_9BURK|nr:hypothetical protein HK414_05090 [Ramlibacter terrae]